MSPSQSSGDYAKKPSMFGKFFEKLLDRLVPPDDAQVITGGCDNADPDRPIYMKRWFVKGKRFSDETAVGPLSRIMVHNIRRSDEDSDQLHDHPWSFVSIILWGGYWEVTEKGRKRIRPFSIIYRPAEWRHRVELDAGKTAWTLVFTSRKKKSWFFYAVSNGLKTPWREFLDKKCMKDI